ncbi:SpaA isopeptide-forming pilin-related protein [Clostridium sp. AN503]|uniref:SpaA isopeptide-forming pilin-related protein n=1 Tax=Clostridium sp. AN503 TaxID=3160598 RepID=UPI00345802D4
MRTQKKKIRAFAWLGVLFLALQSAFPALADSWDPQRRGIAAITTSYVTGSGDSQKRVPVPGVELSLYRIAGVEIRDGQVFYVPSPGLEAFEEILNSGFTEGGNAEAAGQIDESGNLSALLYGSAQKTDADGKAVFAELEAGMYLAKQTAAKNGYYTMKPFLIPVPMMEEDGSGWNYKIEARPKIERHTGGNTPDGGDHPGGGGDRPTPTTAPETVPPFTAVPDPLEPLVPVEMIERLPQTGMRRLPVILCAVGGFILIGGGWVMRRRDRQQREDEE